MKTPHRFLTGTATLLAMAAVLSPPPLLADGQGSLSAALRAPFALARADTLGAVEGRIFGREGGKVAPLPRAVVVVAAGGRRLAVTADERGRYRVGGLDPGDWWVRGLHVGFAETAAQVRVPRGGRVTLDLELESRPIALPPLTVLARPMRPANPATPAPPAEQGEVALRAIEGTPGLAEGGLAQMARALPGQDPAEPRDVLLMRGAATDLKLVLLDGAPLYTPFHMAGLVESFDPASLGGASLFLGGAPARYDGGLSYILDLRGRSPARDRPRGSLSFDLLTGHAFVEGPLGSSAGFMIGSRSVHNLGAPLLGQGDSPYGYGDLLARLELGGGEGEQSLYLTGFWNRESVRLDLLSGAAPFAENAVAGGSFRLLGEPAVGDGAEWGNRALAAGFDAPLGRGTLELRGSLSRYRAELPVGDSLPLFARGRSDRRRLTVDFTRPWREGALRVGASLDEQTSAYEALALDSTATPLPVRARLSGVTGGVYGEILQPLGPSLSFRGGLRLDRFQGDRGVRAAPRLSLTWLLTDQAALTVAAGRYHQYSNLASADVTEGLADAAEGAAPAGTPANAPIRLSVGSADHLIVSLDQTLLPRLRLGLEGFVKTFRGVSSTPGERMHASGVDVRVAREGDGASGWLGYTLTWFWTARGLLSSGGSPFSGRHLLSLGLQTRLTRQTGLRVRASYGDGLPYTAVPVLAGEPAGPRPEAGSSFNQVGDQVLNQAPELSTGLDEGFLRLELELFGSWSPTLSGHETELRPFLRVLNALNRRDALFYRFDRWRGDGPEPLAELPLLPLVGLEWRF